MAFLKTQLTFEPMKSPAHRFSSRIPPNSSSCPTSCMAWHSVSYLLLDELCHSYYNLGIEQYFYHHPDDREKEWSPVLYWRCFGFRLLSALGTPRVEMWEQELKQYFPWNIVMKMNERSVRRRKHEECPSFSVAVKSAAEKGVSFVRSLSIVQRKFATVSISCNLESQHIAIWERQRNHKTMF